MMDEIDYVICPCREHHSAAVNKKKRRCRNCLNQHKDKRWCIACGGTHPWEDHHIGSRKFWPTLTICVCLNCHAILTFWQERYYPDLLAMLVTGGTQILNLIAGSIALFWLIYLRQASRKQAARMMANGGELQEGSPISTRLPPADRR